MSVARGERKVLNHRDTEATEREKFHCNNSSNILFIHRFTQIDADSSAMRARSVSLCDLCVSVVQKK